MKKTSYSDIEKKWLETIKMGWLRHFEPMSPDEVVKAIAAFDNAVAAIPEPAVSAPFEFLPASDLPRIEVLRPFGRIFIFDEHHECMEDALEDLEGLEPEFFNEAGAVHRVNGDETEVSVLCSEGGGVSQIGILLKGAQGIPHEDVISIAAYVYRCCCEGAVPDADDIRLHFFFAGVRAWR